MPRTEKQSSKPLAKMEIAELGKVSSELINVANIDFSSDGIDPSILGLFSAYFGNVRARDSFVRIPGVQDSASSPQNLAGWINLLHRNLRNLSIGISQMVDMEALAKSHHKAANLHRIIDSKIIEITKAHHKKIITGTDAAPVSLSGIPKYKEFTALFAPRTMATIPIKIILKGRDPISVTIKNKGNDSSSDATFLLGLEFFAKTGGPASELYPKTVKDIVTNMVGLAATSELTDRAGDISERIIGGAREAKADAAIIEKIKDKYFRLSETQVEKLVSGIKVFEREFRMILMVGDQISKKTIEAVNLILREGGCNPKSQFTPRSCLEVALLSLQQNYAIDESEIHDYTRNFGDPAKSEYYNPGKAKARVQRMQKIINSEYLDSRIGGGVEEDALDRYFLSKQQVMLAGELEETRERIARGFGQGRK